MRYPLSPKPKRNWRAAMDKKEQYHFSLEFSLYLDRDTAAEFRARAFAEGRDMTEVVRELIKEYLGGKVKV